MEEQPMYSKHGEISAVAAAEDLEPSCLHVRDRLLQGKCARGASCKQELMPCDMANNVSTHTLVCDLSGLNEQRLDFLQATSGQWCHHLRG